MSDEPRPASWLRRSWQVEQGTRTEADEQRMIAAFQRRERERRQQDHDLRRKAMEARELSDALAQADALEPEDET